MVESAITKARFIRRHHGVPLRARRYASRRTQRRIYSNRYTREKDDVPAMLSKNEFVLTADAVKAAGNGDANVGAQRMYNMMHSLEAQV